MSKNTADIPVLSLRSISKSYDGHPVLTGLSMDFFSGTVYCLMAPSGSGKTTLFRLILGLESPDRGEVLFKGSLRRPQISAVFQEDRLLEGFSAVENLFFALGNRYSKETLTTSPPSPRRCARKTGLRILRRNEAASFRPPRTPLSGRNYPHGRTIHRTGSRDKADRHRSDQRTLQRKTFDCFHAREGRCRAS